MKSENFLKLEITRQASDHMDIYLFLHQFRTKGAGGRMMSSFSWGFKFKRDM